MANTQEAIKQIAVLRAGRISLEEFEDWSASYLFEAYGSGDAEALEVAKQIRARLNAYEEDPTEDSLRLELENIKMCLITRQSP